MLWGEEQTPPVRPSHQPEPRQHLPERGHGVRLAVNLRSMSSRLSGPRWRSHPTPRPSGKVGAIARALGVSEATAKKRVYGASAINLQVAAIVTALLRRGEVEDAAAFEAPISAAMIGPITEPMLELQRSADESDGMEDVCQAAWVHEKTDEALALYVRKLASDLFHGTRLLAALKAEQARRAE